MRIFSNRVSPCLMLCALGIPAWAAQPKSDTPAAPTWTAPSGPEPTAEETLILELMNRFRANPSAECDRILSLTKSLPPYFTKGVDLAMFEREMKELKPVPPLVFSLELLASARKHSQYMIINGMSHSEDPKKEGFTGESMSERAKAAGYKFACGAENVFRNAYAPDGSHIGFVIDFGDGGPGGMQAERGHRRNMISGVSTEVGTSAIPHGRFLSVTHNFGRNPTRKAGGVVYADNNANAFYDLGEGRGGITITVDGASCTTWSSGAYAISLPTTATTITATVNGVAYSKPIPAGKDNVSFSVIIPQKADLDAADKLIAAVKAIDSKQTESRLKSAMQLYLATRSMSLDQPRRDDIATLTAGLAERIKTDQDAARAAISATNASALRTAVSTARPLYARTNLEPWWNEVSSYADLVWGINRTLAAATINEDERKRLVDGLAKMRFATPEFQGFVTQSIERLKAKR